MILKLLVLRTSNPLLLANFYSLFGLFFEHHQHDNVPYHYSAIIGETVLEIYPLTKNQAEADKNVRLGFAIDDFENVLTILKENQISFAGPNQTDFGFMTVITDPDGRKVELYKK